jgi:type IV pilus assembly protein PilE
MQRSHGFTLIEVMIVVAIIGILSAIAVPAYGDYVKRGKIVEAVSALSDMRIKMEQYFQDNRSYAGACVAGTVAPLPPATANFTFSCTPAPDATTYTIVATGVTTSNMNGFVYTVNQANARSSTGGSGWTSNATCWATKRDGTC